MAAGGQTWEVYQRKEEEQRKVGEKLKKEGKCAKSGMKREVGKHLAQSTIKENQ